MLGQAPDSVDVTNGLLKLGNDTDERRLFYAGPQPAVGSVPRTRKLFAPPVAPADRQDLWTALGIPFTAGNAASENAAATRAQDIIEQTVVVKEGAITDPDGGPDQIISYVLGDVFHSDPVLVGAPSNYGYYAADLFADARSCETGDPGYRCFADRHRLRRKVLLVGSNDGQLHGIEAGQFEGTFTDGEVVGRFDDGTGREVFGFIPRAAMPAVRDLAETTAQDYVVDGRVAVDDAFIDPIHDGTPGTREWRTLAIGGQREGGAAYYALDLTQPDRLASGDIPQPLAGSGDTYVPSCVAGGVGCGPLPYPSVLWELTDGWDEDGNGYPDLGATWSTVNTGRIRILEDGVAVDKFVAVFGGGMDPEKLGRRGNFLYIVDVETGLPIYKRVLNGSAPSEPAAVDTNQDGYLDTIYIGTTGGRLYKVDLSVPTALTATTVTDVITGQVHPVRRLLDASLVPFAIFDTGGRPIYFPPAVIFVASLGRFALAFGTGDREDLWAVSPAEGRFYVMLDPGFATGMVPRTEATLERVEVDDADRPDRNLLLSPSSGFDAGWFLALDPGERVITKAFALSGVLTFTAYQPETTTGSSGHGAGEEVTCARTGESRVFVVMTTNADALLTLDDMATRFWNVPQFVTNPFFELAQTQNRPGDDPGGTHSDQMTDDLRAVQERLKGLFPRNCRFGSFTINIKTIRSDTGVFFIAPVPVCIVEKNWKEQ